MAETLLDLGVVERTSGSPSGSNHTFLQAFQVALEIHRMSIAWQALVELAVNEMERGKAEHSLELVTFIWENAEVNLVARERAGEMKSNLEALLTQGQIEAVRLQVQERTFADLVQDMSV